MIVCTSCGYENEDTDAFCGSCAGFLEWAGQKVQEPEPEPEPEPDPEPDAEHQGLIERVKEKIGLGDDNATPDARPGSEQSASAPEPAVQAAPAAAGSVAGPTAGPAPTPAPVAPPPPPPSAAPPFVTAPAAPASSTPSAATPPVPVAAATARASAATPVQPAAVKPTAVKARPTVKKSAPTRVINPGDKICGQCGEGNDPARHFCRRCGESLQEAVVFALPWYKRVWRNLTQRKVRSAGDRPHQRRRAIGGSGRGWLTSLVMGLVALAVVVFVILALAGPGKKHIRHDLSAWYHDVANLVHTTYDPIDLTKATASSSAPTHPAHNLIDDASNTSWQAEVTKNDGAGQFVGIQLAGPTTVNKIGFLSGDQDTPQAFVTEPRPQKVLLEFTGGKPYSKTITLKNSASFQTFTVDAPKATGLKITILSAPYPSNGAGKNVSITEVELFTKSH